MRSAMATNRVSWLACGLAAGLAIAYFWPHEPTFANTADRDTQFGMITIPVGTAAAVAQDPMDGVFILDYLTGKLMGAVLSRQVGGFVSFYARDLAKDFDVQGDADPHYCMASGYAQMPNQGQMQMASGVLYIAELNSGKLAAYAFPWKEQGLGGVIPLIPLDVFQWKTPSKSK